MATGARSAESDADRATADKEDEPADQAGESDSPRSQGGNLRGFATTLRADGR
jgi:hypothetical protein